MANKETEAERERVAKMAPRDRAKEARDTEDEMRGKHHAKASSPGERTPQDGHGGYLVTDDKGGKHLPIERHGKLDHHLMGAAWAALHGGYRGHKYQGPGKEDAIKKLSAAYKRAGLETPKE